MATAKKYVSEPADLPADETTLILSTWAVGEDGPTPEQSRRWDTIERAAAAARVEMSGSNWEGGREYNQVEGDRRSLGKFVRRVMRCRRDPLDLTLYYWG